MFINPTVQMLSRGGVSEPDFYGTIFTSAVLKYSQIRKDLLRFCRADAKIGTVKILRPKTSRILSDFWCSEGGKAGACRRQ